MTDLTPILHDLSELAPERFKHSRYTSRKFSGESRQAERFWVVLNDTNHPLDFDGRTADFYLQAACQAECEERGWQWQIKGGGDRYSTEISCEGSQWNARTGFSTSSAALAIATALRDAIKAETTKKPQ